MFSETETGSRMNSIWPRTSVGRGASSELSLCVINGKRFAGCIPPFLGGRGERVKLSAFSTCLDSAHWLSVVGGEFVASWILSDSGDYFVQR